MAHRPNLFVTVYRNTLYFFSLQKMPFLCFYILRMYKTLFKRICKDHGMSIANTDPSEHHRTLLTCLLQIATQFARQCESANHHSSCWMQGKHSNTAWLIAAMFPVSMSLCLLAGAGGCLALSVEHYWSSVVSEGDQARIGCR